MAEWKEQIEELMGKFARCAEHHRSVATTADWRVRRSMDLLQTVRDSPIDVSDISHTIETEKEIMFIHNLRCETWKKCEKRLGEFYKENATWSEDAQRKLDNVQAFYRNNA
jgi:hypothetical protein